MNVEEEIKLLINDFDGKVHLYISDEKGNIIKLNENEIVETASCIKLFILIEYFNQVFQNKKTRGDMISYSPERDYVERGSGIIQYLEDLNLSSKNMATLMMIMSDNIATNKMIEYLGFNNINNTIKELGFKNTELIAEKLDFDIYNSIGKTTSYEYARAYEMILRKEIFTPEVCDEIIELLSKQINNIMLTRFLPPDDVALKGTDGAYINYIATKSGGLGDSERDDIVNCRNDGGIISTKVGNYIISIFISDFEDYCFYDDNPATILGGKISKAIYENFKNSGSIK